MSKFILCYGWKQTLCSSSKGGNYGLPYINILLPTFTWAVMEYYPLATILSSIKVHTLQNRYNVRIY